VFKYIIASFNQATDIASLNQTTEIASLNQTTDIASLNQTTDIASLNQTTDIASLNQTTDIASLNQTTDIASLNQTTDTSFDILRNLDLISTKRENTRATHCTLTELSFDKLKLELRTKYMWNVRIDFLGDFVDGTLDFTVLADRAVLIDRLEKPDSDLPSAAMKLVKPSARSASAIRL